MYKQTISKVKTVHTKLSHVPHIDATSISRSYFKIPQTWTIWTQITEQFKITKQKHFHGGDLVYVKKKFKTVLCVFNQLIHIFITYPIYIRLPCSIFVIPYEICVAHESNGIYCIPPFFTSLLSWRHEHGMKKSRYDTQRVFRATGFFLRAWNRYFYIELCNWLTNFS